MTMEHIRQVKYYHLMCQNHVDLWCFFDENYMCLCTLERHANCFTFNRSKIFECPYNDHCKNDALCFQDQRTCPITKTCICNDCFFGPQCQFYAKGVGLILDDILRYEIQKDTMFSEQPLSVKVSAYVTMFMFGLGLINGICSYLTFRRKDSQQVGCGLYLFASAIASMFTVILFTIKFWFLVLSQMNFITDIVVLRWSCVLIEPLLKTLLYAGNWFHGCISIERAVATCKGVHFHKTNSKRMAKRLIFALPIFIIVTHIHEPINRHLFNDEEERQTWCVILHSQFLRNYNSIITLFHFLTPFLLNFFSALLIIIRIAHQRNIARAEKNYKQHLREQFYEHKHMLISIIILIILSLPRVIISLISDCVKSSRKPWLFLTGYFISFIPSVLIFVVFVLPSELYKKEFKKAIKCW
jgi:hypothetical protein